MAYHFEMRKSKYMLPVNNYKCLAFCFYTAAIYVVVNVPFQAQLHLRDIASGHVVSTVL